MSSSILEAKLAQYGGYEVWRAVEVSKDGSRYYFYTVNDRGSYDRLTKRPTIVSNYSSLSDAKKMARRLDGDRLAKVVKPKTIQGVAINLENTIEYLIDNQILSALMERGNIDE